MSGCTTLYDFFVAPEPPKVLRWNLKFLQEQYLGQNQPRVVLAHSQMTHFEIWSGFKDQLFSSLKQLLSFSGYG